MGAVDTRLISQGRLRRLAAAGDLVLTKKTPGAARVRRPVSDLVDRIASVRKGR
jgi:hypothetical protein